jgi:hypothetical protein
MAELAAKNTCQESDTCTNIQRLYLLKTVLKAVGLRSSRVDLQQSKNAAKFELQFVGDTSKFGDISGLIAAYIER